MRPPLQSLELMALSIACQPSRPSFHIGQGRALDREGAPETRCKGRETRRGHTTQLYSFLSAPAMPASNSPKSSRDHQAHPHHYMYTLPPPHPTSLVFLQLVMLQPESHALLGRRVRGGGLPSPPIHANLPPPPHSHSPPQLEAAFAKATRPPRLGVGAGGGSPPAHRKQTAARRAGELRQRGRPGNAQQTGRTEAGRALEGEAQTPSPSANPGAHRPPSSTSLPQGVSCKLPGCDRVTGAPGKAEAGSGYPLGAPSPPASCPQRPAALHNQSRDICILMPPRSLLLTSAWRAGPGWATTLGSQRPVPGASMGGRWGPGRPPPAPGCESE